MIQLESPEYSPDIFMKDGIIEISSPKSNAFLQARAESPLRGILRLGKHR